MNMQRRKRIEDVEKRIEDLSELMEEIYTAIEEIRDEEQECLDNIPENLQSSDRYKAAESAVEKLGEAYDLVYEFDIDELTSYLEEAKQ